MTLNQIVVFRLGESRCALPLTAVDKVIRAVQVTPLPQAPEIVSGVINLAGKVIPVINVHRRFQLEERDLQLDDRFIIAHTSRRTVALVADSVSGYQELGDRQMIPVEESLSFAPFLRGVAKIEGDIIMIYDLDQFLSLDEETALDRAMVQPEVGEG